MTMTLPTQINLHNTSHGSDSLARGSSGTPGVGTKSNGNLPLSGAGSGLTNNTGTSETGVPDILHWAYKASGGHNVSSETMLLVWTYQYNAPNRVQCSTLANDGICFRIGSGVASPPTAYKHYQIGGRDTNIGSARENPKMLIIDLNDTSNESGSGFSNTDAETYGFGCVRWDIIGTSTLYVFFQRAFLFTTTKASTDIPYFTGTSDWDDLVDLVNGSSYTNKISDEWAKREGSVYSIACPIRFGDASATTNFDDAGAIVFWPDSDVVGDPRVRVTSQAFRVYAHLRDNAGDSLTLSGRYNCGDSTPDWDFDLDYACTIDIDTATFTNVGTFDMGSSVEGAATFDSCGLININNTGVNLDGSTFKNPAGTHLLVINT